MSYEISVIAGAVLRDDEGRYLLVQQGKEPVRGLWGWPGGHAKEGETPQQAAIREIDEELAVTIEIEGEEPIDTGVLSGGETYHMFLARVIGGQMKLDPSELMDAHWFTYDEAVVPGSVGGTRDAAVVHTLLKAEDHAHIGN